MRKKSKNQSNPYNPDNPDVRSKFLVAWLEKDDPLDAVFEAFPDIETSEAYSLAEQLGKSDTLIREKETLLEQVVADDLALPSREDVALEAWKRFKSEKNGEVAQKWMSTVNLILGYNTKPIDSKAANPVPVNKVMKVVESATDEKWSESLQRQQRGLQDYKLEDDD